MKRWRIAVLGLGVVLGLGSVPAAHASPRRGPGADAGNAAAPGTRALVWPMDPATPAAEAEDALAAAGYRVVPFAPIADRLRGHGARDQAREAEVLGRVEEGLQAARQAYLDLRFDDMIATLSAVEQAGLEVLARPRHIPVLWEVAFQLGLAHRARGQDGDAERARARFLLALALAPERRPLRELYGPDVTAAFAEALSARAARLPRPVPVRVTPADARVTVDGVAVPHALDDGPDAAGAGRTANLRPGLHVVRVAAPGYEPAAVLAHVAESGAVAVALDARAEPDPVDRIGASWSAGTLRAHAGAGLRAVQAVAVGVGADLVVVIDAPPARGAARAWLVSGGRVHTPVQRAAVAEAVRAALTARHAAARLDAGLQASPRSAGDAPAAASLWTRWWFWAGVGAVTAGAILAGSALDRGPAHWEIYAPSR